MAGSRRCSARRAVFAGLSGLCLAGVGGCGSSSPTAHPSHSQPARTLSLQAACPQVHVAYDVLVAADPASAGAFEASLHRLWQVGVDEMRDALEPLLGAAGALAGTDRPGFPAARDQLHAAVVGLSATCAALGAPILH